MTDLVIYYSRTNNTKLVADTIANEKDAKLIEVHDKKNRDGAVQYMLGALDAMRGKSTTIEYEAVDIASYDTVYIGTPVWASKPAPAITEFIKVNDFNGVNVILFATMGSSGGNQTIEIMGKTIEEKGGKVIRSFAIAAKNNDLKKLTIDALND
ncbi:flavodoxin family protein [Methanosphaera sp.]